MKLCTYCRLPAIDTSPLQLVVTAQFKRDATAPTLGPDLSVGDQFVAVTRHPQAPYVTPVCADHLELLMRGFRGKADACRALYRDLWSKIQTVLGDLE